MISALEQPRCPMIPALPPTYYTLPPVFIESPYIASEQTPDVPRSLADFANDLCARIAESEDPNKSFAMSPASILAALGMCLHVIEPEKKAQFLAAIHLGNCTENKAHKAIAAALCNMTIPKDFAHGTLEIAEALAHKKDVVVADSLKSLVANTYNADLIVSNDLMHEVNTWVSDKTNGKIPSLLSNNEAVLVLLGAIYLNLEWKTPFQRPSHGWEAEPFLCMNGTSSPVSMMKQTGKFLIYRGDAFDMLEKPYLAPDGRHLSQLIFLPRDPTSLPQIEHDLTDQAIRRYRQATVWEQHVSLSMPKIKMETELHLLDLLKQMGLPMNAIDRNVIPDPRISIDDVIHKTFVAVDEKGTEAAAVTGVAMCGCTAAPSPTAFHVRHSYAYCIMDEGTILFRGRVADAAPLIVDSIP